MLSRTMNLIAAITIPSSFIIAVSPMSLQLADTSRPSGATCAGPNPALPAVTYGHTCEAERLRWGAPMWILRRPSGPWRAGGGAPVAPPAGRRRNLCGDGRISLRRRSVESEEEGVVAADDSPPPPPPPPPARSALTSHRPLIWS